MNRKREQPQCKVCGRVIPAASGRRTYCANECRLRLRREKESALRLVLDGSDKVRPEMIRARAARVEQLRQLAEAGLPLVLPLPKDLLD